MQKKKDEMAELRNLIFKYLKEWKWFALSIFCCLGIAAVFLKTAQKVYQVNANVLIKQDDGPSKGSGAAAAAMKSFSFGLPGSVDVQDELHVIASFSVMRQAVKDLNLNETYTETRFLKSYDRYGKTAFKLNVDPAVVDTLEENIDINLTVSEKGLATLKAKDRNGTICKIKDAPFPLEIQTPYGAFQLETTSFYTPGKSYSYKIKLTGLGWAAEEYMKDVVIGLASKKSNVISLTVQDANVRKSKALLNKLINLYNKDALIEKNMVSQNTAKFIADRLGIISVELSDIEAEVEKYKRNNSIFDMELESKAMLEQNNEVQTRLIEVSTQYAIIEQVEGYIRNVENQFSLLPSSIGLEEKALVALLQSYNELLFDRTKLLRTTTESNPVILQMNAQIGSMRENILQNIQSVKESLFLARKDLLDQNKKFMARYQDAPRIEKEFMDIKRTQVIKEQLVLFLMEKREENALTLAVTAPKAKVIDIAYKNNKPVYPNKMLIPIIALALGILLPVIVIYILDVLKVGFEDKHELEALTSAPVLGEISKSDEAGHIVIKPDAVSSIAEMFRLVRTNIQFVLNKQSEKVILVTSTRSGEGKSFFTINLALSLALTKKKVLLIGLDIRNPKISEYMHLNNSSRGITNYLAEENLKLDDIITRSVENSSVDVIPAGPVPPNPGELLLDKRLDELFDEAREKYDYILIDSAPVGMVSDSFVLDRVADMTLYVTRANYTERTSISFIESLIEEKRLKKLYLIINGTSTQKGYGYGYANTKK